MLCSKGCRENAGEEDVKSEIYTLREYIHGLHEMESETLTITGSVPVDIDELGSRLVYAYERKSGRLIGSAFLYIPIYRNPAVRRVTCVVFYIPVNTTKFNIDTLQDVKLSFIFDDSREGPFRGEARLMR
jgi:hypothetical protein